MFVREIKRYLIISLQHTGTIMKNNNLTVRNLKCPFIHYFYIFANSLANIVVNQDNAWSHVLSSPYKKVITKSINSDSYRQHTPFLHPYIGASRLVLLSNKSAVDVFTVLVFRVSSALPSTISLIRYFFKYFKYLNIQLFLRIAYYFRLAIEQVIYQAIDMTSFKSSRCFVSFVTYTAEKNVVIYRFRSV